jgi:DNA mismatch endonuclease, patch repair protein
MRGNRSIDTRPEVALRSQLHRSGLRFRKDYLLRTADRRARVDVAFPRLKLAVFVDGCFWHACPQHGRQPRSNESYWARKLQRNVERDRQVDVALERAGWRVLRLWEHVPAEEAARVVLQTVARDYALLSAVTAG